MSKPLHKDFGFWAAALLVLVLSIMEARLRIAHTKIAELERISKLAAPPCECQVEQESELELPEPRFPRGRVR